MEVDRELVRIAEASCGYGGVAAWKAMSPAQRSEKVLSWKCNFSWEVEKAMRSCMAKQWADGAKVVCAALKKEVGEHARDWMAFEVDEAECLEEEEDEVVSGMCLVYTVLHKIK